MAITQRAALWPLAQRMVRDAALWRSAALVALFNTMLFGYYSLAPFLFAGLGLSAGEFGYSGILLALATLGAACSTSACWGVAGRLPR